MCQCSVDSKSVPSQGKKDDRLARFFFILPNQSESTKIHIITYIRIRPKIENTNDKTIIK